MRLERIIIYGFIFMLGIYVGNLFRLYDMIPDSLENYLLSLI